MSKNKDSFNGDRVYRYCAALCSVLANHKRLKIINQLRKKESSAKGLLALLKIPKANLSQHMKLLKEKGLIASRHKSTSVYYRLSHPKIIKVFDLLQEILIDIIKEQQKILNGPSRKKK